MDGTVVSDLISLTPELWPLVGRVHSRLVPQNSRATAQLTGTAPPLPLLTQGSHRGKQAQGPSPRTLIRTLCTTNLIRGAHACCLPMGPA